MSLVRSLLIVTAICIGVAAANAQTAFVTFLNNSADVSLKTVDLYVTQQNVTEKIEDLAFQQTKNLEGIFGDLPVNLKVAPGSSTSISEAVVSYDFTPKSDSGYMAIVSGVRTPAQYAPNPNSRNGNCNHDFPNSTRDCRSL